MRISSLFIFGTGSADRFSFLNLRHAPYLRLTPHRQAKGRTESFIPTFTPFKIFLNQHKNRSSSLYLFLYWTHWITWDQSVYGDYQTRGWSFLTKPLLLHFSFFLHSLNFSYTSFYQVLSYSYFYPRWLLATNHFIAWT